MNWHRRLPALFVLLALAGCAQGVTGQVQTPYSRYSPENNGNMHASGGGDGGGDRRQYVAGEVLRNSGVLRCRRATAEP